MLSSLSEHYRRTTGLDRGDHVLDDEVVPARVGRQSSVQLLDTQTRLAGDRTVRL